MRDAPERWSFCALAVTTHDFKKKQKQNKTKQNKKKKKNRIDYSTTLLNVGSEKK